MEILGGIQTLSLQHWGAVWPLVSEYVEILSCQSLWELAALCETFDVLT